MTGPPRQLIESVAEGICWQVLEQHPRVQEVRRQQAHARLARATVCERGACGKERGLPLEGDPHPTLRDRVVHSEGPVENSVILHSEGPVENSVIVV